MQSLTAADAPEAAPHQNRQQQRRSAQKGAEQKRAAADLPQPVAFALEIIKVLMALVPVARATLGCPSRAYGITPLVVLREVREQ